MAGRQAVRPRRRSRDGLAQDEIARDAAAAEATASDADGGGGMVRRPTGLLVAELDAMTMSITELVSGLRGGLRSRGGKLPPLGRARLRDDLPPPAAPRPLDPASADPANTDPTASVPQDTPAPNSPDTHSADADSPDADDDGLPPAPRLLGEVRPGVHLVDLSGRRVEIHARRSPQARRVILRLTPHGRVDLVMPERAAETTAVRFLERQLGWLAEQLQTQPAAVRLVDGAELPFRGDPHRIRHDPAGRGGVWLAPAAGDAAPPEIRVSGAAAHLPRRVADWLRQEARADLTARTAATARRAGFRLPPVTVRDTTSRWGSCSVRSGIAYSWRLILAPDAVRDYVVAHEVAHLAEMNHSPRFWAVVDRLTPHAGMAREWLRRNGASLHRYR